MKFAFVAAMALFAAVSATTSSHAGCMNCQIQSRNPSASTPGKFEYRISCIDDSSGDELNSLITAGSDEEALQIMQATKC